MSAILQGREKVVIYRCAEGLLVELRADLE